MMTKEKLQNKITELKSIKSINNKSSWELGQLNVLNTWLSDMEEQEKIIDDFIFGYDYQRDNDIINRLKLKLFGEVKGK